MAASRVIVFPAVHTALTGVQLFDRLPPESLKHNAPIHVVAQ